MYSQMKSRKTLFRKAISFLIVLCMMISSILPLMAVTASAAAPASYTTITTNSTASVSITSSGDAKYFKFVPTQSGTYKFYSTNYSSDPYGALLDASGNTLATNDDGGTDYNFSITYDCTANTTYYIKAYLYSSSSTGSYTLNVQTVSVVTPTPTPAPGGSVVDITESGAYALFNSGATSSSGNRYSSSQGVDRNPDSHSYSNSGYDIYGQMPSNSTLTLGMGLSFTVSQTVTERATLTVYAYDVDEESGERDTVYLVDETDNTRTPVGYLSGMNDQWNTTTIHVDNSNFTKGHTYHFETTISDTSGSAVWWVYIRTVSIQMTTDHNPDPIPDDDDIVITGHNFDATINNSGTVTTNLYLKTSGDITYTLEYAASINGNQKGSSLNQTIAATPSGTSKQISFALESGSPKGTYQIDVVIKDSQGNTVTSYTTTAGYSYSATTYDANGGSNNFPIDTNAYSSGDTVTVKFDYVPSMYGYTFLGWSTDRNATEPMYTENGTKTFTIGASDVTLYAVWGLDVCAHEWTETSRTDATCTTDGVINYTCSCGETKVGIIPALGHNIETTIEIEVTCTSDGLIVDRCINDGCDYEKRTVIHGEHNYSVTDRQDAACETPGYVEYTCSNCGDKKYEYFDGAHNYVESARVEPQVDVEGSITYTCTKCGDSYDIILPALTPVLKNSSVLLIQDSLPWAEDVNRSLLETLKDRGVVSSYNIINTSALASFDLSQYGVVFIANDQSTAMYNRLAANTEKLENYVRAGGNLIYGACDEGWGGCGSLTHALPGGVTTSNYYSVHNYIVNELHPVVTGVNTDNRSLRDELLKGNYCSHTYFNKATLPAGTDIILRDANGNPTLIEYNLGDGTVIASGLTWEYFYVRDHYNMVTNYSKYAYDDLLTYMVYMSNTCEHNYEMAEIVEVTCEENGYTKYVCSICSHEYMGDIVIAEGHTYTETSRTEPTCTLNGEIVYTCACGDIKIETIMASGHSWELVSSVASTCTAYGEVVYACNCGETRSELLEPTQHDYQITNTVEPTCTTDGYIDFACQNAGCEATKRQALEKLGHCYGNDNVCDRCGHTIEIHTHDCVVNVVAPTCTAMGYTEYTCFCGYSYRDSFVEPIRHSWNSGEVTIVATCTIDGLMTYTCQNCGATKTAVIKAGHEWNEVVTVEKTCTTDGSMTKTCINCGKVEVEVIPAGHDWNNGVEIVAPTCKTEGSKLCGCSICGATEVFAIAALGHNYVNGVCTRCGTKFIDDVTPSTHPIYGMYFEIDDILSDYGPSLIDEYGLLLDYNSDANLEKVGVYLTQDGTMWRRCIAVKGTNIRYATYVPYLSYESDIKYTGLNHDWINIFRLSENDKGVWCYSDFATIGVNLEDAYGNLLLSLYDIGQAGAETRIFDDLDEMKAWLYDECIEHNSSEWIVDIPASCVPGSQHKECTVCHVTVETEEIPAVSAHETSDWILDVAPTATQTGIRHKECTVCHTVLETEVMPILAKLVVDNVEAEAGKTVRVTIDIQNNPGIIGAVLTLTYDPALTLINAEAGRAWNSLNFTMPHSFSNPCNFVWDGVSGADFSNGSIIILTFEIPSGVAVGTVYNISASYTYGNMINENLEAVDLEIENGSITIVNTVGDVNDDGVVDVADVIVLRRYLAGGYEVVIDEFAADMDNDGYITVADVVLLRRFLVG